VAPLLAAAALATFFAAAALVRATVPFPAEDAIDLRLEHLLAPGARYDVVFFGSSVVRRGVVPEVLDAELARRGVPLRTFNMAATGSQPFETDHLVQIVLEGMERTPRLVVVEALSPRFESLIPPVNAYGDKLVYWHTLANTARVLRARARARVAGDPGGSATRHLKHALFRLASVGQADRIGARWLGVGDGRAAARQAIARRRGFAPLAPAPGEPERFVPPAGWAHAVAGLDARNGGAPVERTIDPEWLAGQIARIRAAGARVVYLVGPSLRANVEVHWLAREGVLPDLLAFDSGSRHPELFAASARRDAIHLNEAGARLWSRALAARLAAWLAGAGADGAPSGDAAGATSG
jgi:hypothetical protein